MLESGGGAMRCLPSGSSACEYGERCRAGDRCRTPGTECISGCCRIPVVGLPCGTTQCTADKPACCDDTCKTHAECEDNPTTDECAGPAHCPPNHHCHLGGASTYCAASIHRNAALLCTKDKDCPRAFCDQGVKPRCVQDGAYRICQC
jgi:hypothetical protein